jgi:RHS repeat-associated protein
MAAPSIALPKGGGAIRGIGEKFAANAVTGTGAMIVPIAISPGRAGFGPRFSLAYDSAEGNGAFGLGWTLSTPAITRKTDKGLPKYFDADESDVFVLSGIEDLVPVLVDDGQSWRRETLPPRTVGGRSYRIARYRPRIEGMFARIERWTNADDPTDTFWRSITKDNTTTWYGKTAESRIADPADAAHVFSWLVCESSDDKGNVIAYGYKQEDSVGVDASQAHECNRTAQTRSSNRYLKRVRYGNRTPYLPVLAPDRPLTPLPVASDWMFEVVFDYGEHDLDGSLPSENPTRTWSTRRDVFSSYRAGFEIRTYRICRRVLMFHHFAEEPDVGAVCLVRSTDFTYSFDSDPEAATNSIFSFLVAATQTGYKRRPNGGTTAYLAKPSPPIELTYSAATIHEELKELDALSLENLPYGLGSAQSEWVDLDGDGSSGVLTEQAEGWLYKRNIGPAKAATAQFAPVEALASAPSVSVADGRAQFMDLAGDGRADVVELDGPMRGFFERSDEGWTTFSPFGSCPNIDLADPNARLIDLDGDGHADILVTEDEAFRWHASLAEGGFGPAELIHHAEDEEKGPRLVFADAEQSIYLADLSGDGLTDLVRIRNSDVCYWPNLGYGRFGAKVTMDRAPTFDAPDHFEQRRVRLADVDGSGMSDILYLGQEGVTIWRNEAGNSWGEPHRVAVLPPVDSLSSVVVVDLLGNGTACLVWSSIAEQDAGRHVRYVDLMGGGKPHLLVGAKNNLGAEIRVGYVPSTAFYVADALAGKPWITHLPFPVHVVERVETFDRLSRNRFVTRYAYHHGYFDGEEREFRGFGMVEQFDTEEFAALSAAGEFPIGDNVDAASHIPPVLTRTWFHTGVHVGRDHVSNFFAGLLDVEDEGEYYREPGLDDEQASALLLDDTLLPPGLSAEEEREACRALKGLMLRQEIYALDGTEKEKQPYAVTEQNFTVRLLQPRQAGNRHAVVFTHAREAIGHHYERSPSDPRTSHSLTLEVDDFGNALKTVAVGYGRRRPDASLSVRDQAIQGRVHVTYTEGDVTNFVTEADAYRAPLPCEMRVYELTGYVPSGASGRFRMSDVVSFGASGRPTLVFDSEIHHEDQPSGGKQRRLLKRSRTLYRPDDFGASRSDSNALLPRGELESLALQGETYTLAFTPGLLSRVYLRPSENEPPEALLPDPAAVLPIDLQGGHTADRGGYVDIDADNHWWTPTGRAFFTAAAVSTPAAEHADARQNFFLPQRFRDPFGEDTIVVYDDRKLLLRETRDALDNTVRAENDYRVLQPKMVTNANGNRTAAAFDALGLVVATAVMGKVGEDVGDSLANVDVDVLASEISAFLANPLGRAAQLLQGASTCVLYDPDRFARTGQPSFAATLARETHAGVLPAGAQSRIQISVIYSDGFGREIQVKTRAEPGFVPRRDADGKILLTADGQPEMTATVVAPRWVASGWTVFNNKAKPVRNYEPFFTDRLDFEFDVRISTSSVTLYDPTGRAVAVLHPNHTWQKVVFDAWRQETWDVNDTVLAEPPDDPAVGDLFRRLPVDEYLPSWHSARILGALGPEERSAAAQAEVHAATPSVAHMDSLGRTFLVVSHNRFRRTDALAVEEELHRARVAYDIEGNEREVRDDLDRVVMRYEYDMRATRIHIASMESGSRWVLNDVSGTMIRAWDARRQRFRATYDPLRRLSESRVQQDAAGEVLIGRIVYGESAADADARNSRGQIVRVFDQAGVSTNERFDFKGNLLSSQRQLAREYKTTLDWSGLVPLEADIFRNGVAYDALNRPVELTTPDAGVVRPTYNEANLLERVDVRLRGEPAVTSFVTEVDYDAKGRRQTMGFGNGVRTRYQYDPRTLRLARMETARGAKLLQDLEYTYDPVGNVTHIKDHAQQEIYFRNKRVEPSNDYAYDSLYRLIEATGREHLGQAGALPNAPTAPDALNAFHMRHAHPGDGTAMGRYVKQYFYDVADNILRMLHRGSDPAHAGWSRVNSYEQASQIDPGVASNRLTRSTVAGVLEHYGYDGLPGLHGNVTSMPHLPMMRVNHADQLRASSRQIVSNGGTPEITYYVYDSSGLRVRKVTERQAAAGATPTRKQERIYLGHFEIYRTFAGDGETVDLERESAHIVDDQQRIAIVDTRTRGTDSSPERSIRYQASNHLGSACLELDANAQILSYEEYYPFGATSYHAVRDQTEAPKRFRYLGKERDEESGLSYHGARYYATWLGRWISADPAGLADGHNLYAYSRNNPLVLSDPGGTDSRKVSKLKEKLGKAAYEQAELGDKVDELRETATKLEDKVEDLKNKVDKIESDIKSLQSSHNNYAKNNARMQRDMRRAVAAHKKAVNDLINVNNTLPGVQDKLAKKSNEVVKLQSKGLDLGLDSNAIQQVESDARSRWVGKKFAKFGKALAKLGPLGTFVGIAIGIQLLAEGKVWAAAKEFVGAIPLIGDIVDLVELGGSLISWITGGGDDDKGPTVGEMVQSTIQIAQMKSQGWKLIAVTWEPEEAPAGGSQEAGGGKAPEPEGAAKKSFEPRFVSLPGMTLSMVPSKRGMRMDSWLTLPMAGNVDEWWQWDEYKILEIGILNKKLQLLPTQLGLTLKGMF